MSGRRHCSNDPLLVLWNLRYQPLQLLSLSQSGNCGRQNSDRESQLLEVLFVVAGRSETWSKGDRLTV